ncbi:MAG: redox-sensing transcriptional repressor Rex [Caldilineaceae bacterium]|nr:redox-sensing transcriptional repressor Rex [Caldilineaceae bacterium]
MSVDTTKHKSHQCEQHQCEQPESSHRLAPTIVVRRLAIYMREVESLAQEGCQVVSSHQLAERVGVSSAQVRKDLSYFGDFGKQGSGYAISALRTALCQILHIDREWSVIMVGVGHLGRALIHNDSLQKQGFRIDAVFDNDRRKIGKWVGDHQIVGMREFCRYVEALGAQIGIITTPARSAQLVADRMIAAGIVCILNYAPTSICVPDYVHVQSIDPVLHFYQMTYYLTAHTRGYPRHYHQASEAEPQPAYPETAWSEAAL